MNHLETKTEKPVVVLLHAFPFSADMWQPNLDSLSKNFRLITPDLLGLGKSSKKGSSSIEAMARDVFLHLEDLQIKEPVFLAGISMGGYVAFEFFRNYPDQVKGLGLFSTRPDADTAEISEKRFQGIEKIKKEGLDSFLEGALPKLLGSTTLQDQPQVLATLKEIASKNTDDGVADALLAIARRRDSTHLLRKIKCPLLIMGGREDAVIPAAVAETMSAQIPNSMIHIFESSGHLLNLESPNEFESVFINFMDLHF